jgi:predicted transcriptional regulator
MMDTLRTLSGKEIRDWRTRLQWSQETLARRAGVTVRTIWRVEDGADSQLSTYQAIIEALKAGDAEQKSATTSEA